MLTKYLRVTTVEVTTDRENEIWHNGYSFGMKTGAQELIEHLQYTVNDGGSMTDAYDIKMLIYDLWKQIKLDGALYATRLPEEMEALEGKAKELSVTQLRQEIDRG